MLFRSFLRSCRFCCRPPSPADRRPRYSWVLHRMPVCCPPGWAVRMRNSRRTSKAPSGANDQMVAAAHSRPPVDLRSPIRHHSSGALRVVVGFHRKNTTSRFHQVIFCRYRLSPQIHIAHSQKRGGIGPHPSLIPFRKTGIRAIRISSCGQEAKKPLLHPTCVDSRMF